MAVVPTYFVSPTGSPANSGTSESSPWTLSHAFDNVSAPSVIHIKAGNYGPLQDTFTGSGTAQAPIRFSGYVNTPGDIDAILGANKTTLQGTVVKNGNTWTLGRTVNTSEGPCFVGTTTNSRPDQDKGLEFIGDWLIIENLAFQGYSKPFIVTGNNNVIDNVFTTMAGNHNPADLTGFSTTFPTGAYLGWGSITSGNDLQMTNCYHINPGAEGFKVVNSSRPYLDNCTTENDVVGTPYDATSGDGNSTDYDFLISSNTNNGTFKNLSVIRDDGAVNTGHGICFKPADGNPCTDHLVEDFITVNSRIETQFPTTERITYRRGVIKSTHNNILLSENHLAEVANASRYVTIEQVEFINTRWRSGSWDDITTGYVHGARDCVIRNCLFYREDSFTSMPYSAWSISYGFPQYLYTTENITFENCTVHGYLRLWEVDKPNTNIQVKNCVIDGISGDNIHVRYNDGPGPRAGTAGPYPLDVFYTNCNFSNNAFTAPSGTNITTFAPGLADTTNNDYRLTSTSPLIDIGVVTSTTVDINGNPRPQGAAYDLGAYEYVGSPSSTATILGELRKWHTLTLEWEHSTVQDELDGPADINPTLDYRLLVTFTRPDSTVFVKQGYFAGDGNTANTSATFGTKWHCKITPDQEGQWEFSVRFVFSTDIFREYPVNLSTGGVGYEFDGDSGSFVVGATNKTGVDFRAKGRLQVVGGRYRQFAETGEYFVKAGADSPETTLAYEDFDNTTPGRVSPAGNQKLKSWSPHIQDWVSGDPEWGVSEGRGLIGAINYLSSQGMNSMSMLTMNVNGDGDQVHPWAETNKDLLDGAGSPDTGNRLRFDVSKLDQWLIVFEHMMQKGVHLHIKLQETENDQLMDNGDLLDTRKMYLQQLIARFSHLLALTWNIGEENSQTAPQEIAMAKYIADRDPHNNLIVMHTYPNQKSKYNSLTGSQSELTGASLQIDTPSSVNSEVRQWIDASAAAGKQWVVANDEIGHFSTGVAADASYPGDKGIQADNRDTIRQSVLWGTLMAGGEGVEYYYGYQTGETDLTAEDHRSRATKWADAKYALDFYSAVDFNSMTPDNSIVNGSGNFAMRNDGVEYIAYFQNASNQTIDISPGTYSVKWFDPRNGGVFQNGTIVEVSGGTDTVIGNPPSSTTSDWAVQLLNIASGNIVYVDTTYGFDANDSTTFYNQAINAEKGSGNTLVFRDMGSPWYITGSNRKFDVNDLTIIFEPGCVFEAKQGFWNGTNNDRLFWISRATNLKIIGYGATFKMHKSDFTVGEGSHSIEINEGVNCEIKGLTLDGSGGDGIYLIECDGPILIEDVDSVNHRRQGISVISANNLTIRHSWFHSTSGTNPQAGIDFEPNNNTNDVGTVLIENCAFFDNHNAGIMYGFFSTDGDATPIDITVNDCYVANNDLDSNNILDDLNRGAIRIGSSDTAGKYPPNNDNPLQGSIVMNRMAVDKDQLLFFKSRNQSTAYSVTFNDCAIHDIWANGDNTQPPIFLETPTYDVNCRLGGLAFNDVLLDHDNTGNWMTILAGQTVDAVEDITGNITVLAPNGSSGINYTGSYNPAQNVNVTVSETFVTSLPTTTVDISVLERYAVKNIGQRATARITRTSADTSYPLFVKYSFTSESQATPVKQGNDIHRLPGAVIIPAGETTADIEIVPRNTGIVDPDRDMFIDIEARDHYSLGSTTQALLTIVDSLGAPCVSDYVDENGLVVIYPEDLTLTGSWATATTKGGYTNTGYIRWTGSDNFNTPGVGVISATIDIENPGTYRFQWYSTIGQGTSIADFNDSWLRFPDASDFYAVRGASVVYPFGSGKTPNPNGAGSGGWFKVYVNNLNWSWQTTTSDNDPHDIYVDFDTPGVYTMEISARSFDHLIDRIVLYQASVPDPLNLSNTETPCVASTDTTAPTVTSISAINVTENSFDVRWTLDEAGTGQVEYGLTTGYGSTTTLDSTLKATHTQTVSGLQPDTLYYFRVTGQDAAANVYTGSQQSTTTSAAAVPEQGIRFIRTQVGDNKVFNVQVGDNLLPNSN